MNVEPWMVLSLVAAFAIFSLVGLALIFVILSTGSNDEEWEEMVDRQLDLLEELVHLAGDCTLVATDGQLFTCISHGVVLPAGTTCPVAQAKDYLDA